MDHIVLTSLNPYFKLEYQKQCYWQWKKTGHDIVTFNCEEEAGQLRESGILAEDICVIDGGETGMDLFGKSVPKITAVLKRAAEMRKSQYILTNADIYPAVRKPVFDYLDYINNIVALTRNECVHIATDNFFSSIPYRGGLDIFYFSSKGLDAINSSLESYAVSRRMAFGVPGWDYFLGYLVDLNGGLIMDGEVFLHQSHPTSYGSIDEFENYVLSMTKRGKFRGKNTSELVDEFSKYIDFNCKNNARSSKSLKSIYYSKPKENFGKIIDEDASSIVSQVGRVIESAKVHLSLDKNFYSFILMQMENVSWIAATSLRDSKLYFLPCITSSLILLYSQLLVREKKGELKIIREYPKGSLHGVVLRQILRIDSEVDRLKCLIDLFCRELIEHQIFNPELFKYLVLEANSDRQLVLASEILKFCQKG